MTARPRPAGRRGLWIIVSVSLIAGVIVTVALVFTSRTSFDGTGGRDLAFGRPFAWVVQDQSAYDPPPRTLMSVATPWENPTHVRLASASADAGLVAAGIAAVLGAGVWLPRRLRRS